MPLWNIIPHIMANSKYAQGHKDRYLDTDTRILSQEIFMCNTKAIIFTTWLWIIFNVFFKYQSHVQSVKYKIKIVFKGILAVEKLLAKLMFWKSRRNSMVNVTVKKMCIL